MAPPLIACMCLLVCVRVCVFTVIIGSAAILFFLILYGLYLYLYRYKGSYHTNEPKNLESPSSSRPLTEPPTKEKDLQEVQDEPHKG